MTYVYLLSQAKFDVKDSSIQPKYLTDIPRRREEYELIMAQGGTPSAISLVFFDKEWNICYIV